MDFNSKEKFYRNKKIVFLDVDGVLNSVDTTAHAPDGSLGVSSGKVDLLKKIITEAKADIVLSSSWRNILESDPSYKYLIRQLEYKGLYILDKTPNVGCHRGKEIRQWLDAHEEIEQFVILDDEFIQEFEECGLSEHLVHTELIDGLTKEDVTKAIQILNGEFNYIPCSFSKDELRFIQGTLGMCEVKKIYSKEQSYFHSSDLRNKIKLILTKENVDQTDIDQKEDKSLASTPTSSENHFGRKLE